MKKVKRFLIALLCVCVLSGIMMTVASAVTILTIINLTVTAPAVGKKPAETTASVPDHAHSVVKELEWSGNFDSNGAFMAGEKYTATVTMGIKSGEDWKFSDKATMSVKVNEKAADKIWYINDKKLEVVYTFPKLAEPKAPTVLKEAEITLTAPEAGKTPATTAKVPSGASYTVKKVEWDGSLSSGKFKEYTEYTAYVTLGIKSGKNAVFSGDTFDAYVNGYLIDEIRWKSDSEIIVPVEFEKTGAAQSSSSSSSTSKSVISIIRLTLDAPEAGKTPATTASLPSTAHSTVQSVKWSGQLDADGTFMPGGRYTATVTMGIKPGANYRFSSKSITATVNSKSADDVFWYSDDMVEVIYTFPALPEGKTVLKEAEITLAAPAAGETPATTAKVPSGASYTVKKVEWMGSLSNGKFKAGTSYTAYITLGIKSGKNAVFSDVTFDANVNGYIIDEIRWVSDSTIIVPVEFEKTPDNVPSSNPGTSASTGTAYASTQMVEIDGKKVEFQMYALKDANGNLTNYIKVRDLALALNSTKAQFAVEYDGAVNLVAGSAYTVTGTENSTPFRGDRAYSKPTSPTKVNGKASDLEAIVLTDDNGGGYTYYKLRDLGQKLGFNVGWSAEKGVYIESDKSYTG